MASNSDTPRARALGAEIRQARERAGYSQTELGALVSRGKSYISRWENGRLIPSETDTAQVLQALGVHGSERTRLLDLAKDALDPDWLAPGVDRQLAALAEYERTAETIYSVEPLMIPGLMQTFEYAAHVSVAHGDTRGEALQRAHLRMGRQHVLNRVRLIAFIGECALRNNLFPGEILKSQISHLEDLTSKGNVSLHVIPSDATPVPVLTGPWTLIEFPGQVRPIVHLEHYASSATITDGKSVSRYREALGTIFDTVRGPEDSIQTLADIIKSKET